MREPRPSGVLPRTLTFTATVRSAASLSAAEANGRGECVREAILA